MTTTLPIPTVSEANRREHHMQRHKRRKGQRTHTHAGLCQHRRPEGNLFHIEIVRIAPGGAQIYDADNIAASVKGIIDGVADYLRIDDGSDRLWWKIRQEKGQPGVRITITPLDAAPHRARLEVWD